MEKVECQKRVKMGIPLVSTKNKESKREFLLLVLKIKKKWEFPCLYLANNNVRGFLMKNVGKIFEFPNH